MAAFVGRQRELSMLEDLLAKVGPHDGAPRPGRCLLMRGRRRIGKSSLVETFVDRAGVPAMFFTASGAASEIELEAFADAVASSTFADNEQSADAMTGNWSTALRLLNGVLPDDRPSIVVIDEVPYLMNTVDAFEGILQRAWDRELSRKPVLLILIGSELSMMEALSEYGRPFHQRGTEMVLGPLNPAEVGTMLALEPAEAFDAALVTGGLPMICAAWEPGAGLWDFLGAQLTNPLSPLLVSAERSLAAEFPGSQITGTVLAAIGSGERTFTNIARAGSGVPHSSLTRALETLVGKRTVAADLPLFTKLSKDRRYRVTDPYLRFWLTFVGPYMAEIERMRGDLTVARARAGWTSWRGRAVEPLVREALARILPDDKLPTAQAIGSYWTRTNSIEIDIVGADREPVARKLLFLGSIKWLEQSPFDAHDLVALQRHRAILTDEPLPLVAVSRSGIEGPGLDAAYGPADLITAWR
jgi:uncharacterized protein